MEVDGDPHHHRMVLIDVVVDCSRSDVLSGCDHIATEPVGGIDNCAIVGAWLIASGVTAVGRPHEVHHRIRLGVCGTDSGNALIDPLSIEYLLLRDGDAFMRECHLKGGLLTGHAVDLG